MYSSLMPVKCNIIIFIFRSKDVIMSDLYRHFDDDINKHTNDDEEDKESSLLIDTMDISPSMLSTSSPAKTDWLGQLVNQHR